MDDTDRTLLRLLRENARAPVAALAAGCGVSRGTIQNRLARLQKIGVIQGFTIRLRPEAKPAEVRAIMMLEVVGSRAAAAIRALRGLPEVASLHSTNGRWDLVAELTAENLAAFDAVLRRIRLIDGIANSETSLLLSDRF
jgi:DNA-binding Lrp family transcriptional regulator